MVDKLTVDQMQKLEEIEGFRKVVEHSHHLVQELAANRAAPAKILARICESIARDMSQMRQRALTKNIGTIADAAGSLAVMAARGGGDEHETSRPRGRRAQSAGYSSIMPTR